MLSPLYFQIVECSENASDDNDNPAFVVRGQSSAISFAEGGQFNLGLVRALYPLFIQEQKMCSLVSQPEEKDESVIQRSIGLAASSGGPTSEKQW
jgi:hypothetical protein